MKYKAFLLIGACFFSGEQHATSPKSEAMAALAQLPIRQVVLWGHKLHSHTHSYIHYAFYKAFSYLGYPTYWLDDTDDVKNMDFSRTLFITEGQVDQHIPLLDDCFYILHNCYSNKYKELYEQGNCITLQVYTHKCTKQPVIKIEDYIYSDPTHKCIYMPWATDLLPHEIDAVKEQLTCEKISACFFVGTVGDGVFGNIHQIQPFIDACKENGIEFRHMGGVSEEVNRQFIRFSYMAPAIQGEWQCREGYIPCRIFKNISYGQLGITNCPVVYDLFKDRVVYNPDTYQLFYDAQKRLQTLTVEELHEMMDFVKHRHTYFNRIKHLAHFMYSVKVSSQRNESSHKYWGRRKKKHA